MAVKTYVFNAPAEAKLFVGAEEYHGGDTVEIDESVVVDPRLNEVVAATAPTQTSSPPSGASTSGPQSAGTSEGDKGGTPK